MPATDAQSSTPKIFTPLTLGGTTPVQLQHRVIMAPCTRLRATEDNLPTELIAKYYSQRATDGGLLIVEAAVISPAARGHMDSPGLFTAAQTKAWEPVVQAVHAKGGKIFVQVFHVGRVSHPLNQPNRQLPVAPSAVSMDTIKSRTGTREGRKNFVTPRALEVEEIPEILADYKAATQNALAAGFDGVELHSANGYLLEEFLCDSTNKRTDQYGGSIENRARIIFEALEAILEVADSSKVGIRLSPFCVHFECTDSTPAETYSYVVKKLNEYNLAYVHMEEPRDFHQPGDVVPEQGNARFFRPMFDGVLISAGGYDRTEAIETVDEGCADAVAFGRDFIATPDLVKRLEQNAPLNERDPSNFYPQPGNSLELGYTDYPFLEDKEVEK